MKQKWIPLILSVLVTCTSCSLIPKEEELPEAPILYAVKNVEHEEVEVSRGDIFLWHTYNCKYQPANEEVLAFAQGGQAIAAVYVDKGDVVHPGDLIAELDNTQVLQDISKQKRAVESLEMQISQQNDFLDGQKQRIRILSNGAENDPEAYQGQIDALNQAINSANERISYLYSLLSIEEIRLDELNESLRERQIYASIEGSVSYAIQLEDETVYTKEGQIVCSIMDFSTASFVGEFDKNYFTEGQTVEITYNGEEHEAVVDSIEQQDVQDTSVESEGDDATEEDQPAEKVVTVHFILNTPDTSLKAGASGSIKLVKESRENVLYLPDDIVYHNGGSYYVYYIDEKGFKTVKEVSVGLKAEDKIEIVSGLSEGEKVLQ